MDTGKLLRNARRRHGVTQKSLAARASAGRSAISRIERNETSPTVEWLRELLFLLGEDLVIEARRRRIDVDRDAMAERLRLTPDERVQRGMAEARKAIEEERSQRSCRGSGS